MNSNTKETVHIISMPIDPTYKVIVARNTCNIKELFIMVGIDEAEYNEIKNSDYLYLVRGNCRFHISPDDIVCYGDIDFHEGSEDCKQLDTFNWLEHLGAKGIAIPSRYNYDKHECTTPINKYLWTETFRNSTLCRYFHGCLGKPQYTLIFREIK